MDYIEKGRDEEEIILKVKHADNIHNEAIAELFRSEKDAIQLIKKKEIIQNLEKAVDFCLDTANVIESILIKNS